MGLDLRALSLSGGGFLGGLLKGRRQRREDDLREEDRQYSRQMQQSQLDRLLESLDVQRQSAQSVDAERQRKAATETAEVEAAFQGLMGLEGMTEPRARALARDPAGARVLLAPKPTAEPKPRQVRTENFGGKAGRVDDEGNFLGYVTGPDGKPLAHGSPPTPKDTSEMTLQRQFTREQGLQQDYSQNATIKDAYAVANAVAAVQSAAQHKTPQGDISMIYGVVKLLDPASAVKEGEIDLQTAARSIGTRGVALWNKAKSGRVLTDEERQAMVDLLMTRVQGEQERIAPIQQRFGQRSRQFGADSAYVAPDPFAGINVGGNQPPAGFRPPPPIIKK